MGWCLYAFGGWLLFINVSYTMLGLQNDGWDDLNAVSAMACVIAAVEAGVSIFLSQPENWDSVWGSMEQLVSDGDQRGKTPGWVTTTLLAVILLFIVAMCIVAILIMIMSFMMMLAVFAPVAVMTITVVVVVIMVCFVTVPFLIMVMVMLYPVHLPNRLIRSKD